MKIIIFFTLFVGSFSLAAETDPKVAYSMSREGKAVIIDVREEDEVKIGMIAGALWFPLSKIENSAQWESEFKAKTKDKKIFLYCRSGKRSEKVKDILKKNNISSENLGGYEDLKLIL